MENTAKLLLGEDGSAQWYLALGGEAWVGPLTSSDVYKKILSKEITWGHYLWKPGDLDWTRICDLPFFQATFPDRPGKSMHSKIQARLAEELSLKQKTVQKAQQNKKTPPPPPSIPDGPLEKIWYLHDEGSQLGPFSFEEVTRFLKINRIDPHVYAWRDGMANWDRLDRIRIFEDALKHIAVSRAHSAQDQRGTPRRPLVARIFLSHDDAMIVAVCRDISVGGMQVLTDKVPGGPGTRLKMNVSPSGSEDTKKIQPFIAEGTVVRVLEDHCGFSFRFEKLPDRARRAIESYITSAI